MQRIQSYEGRQSDRESQPRRATQPVCVQVRHCCQDETSGSHQRMNDPCADQKNPHQGRALREQRRQRSQRKSLCKKARRQEVLEVGEDASVAIVARYCDHQCCCQQRQPEGHERPRQREDCAKQGDLGKNCQQRRGRLDTEPTDQSSVQCGKHGERVLRAESQEGIVAVQLRMQVCQGLQEI